MKHEQNAPAFELGRDGQCPLVTFVQPDGSSKEFRYLDFRRVRYFPEDTVELRFATAIVTLHGRNLLPLWRAIRSRRVRLLRVGRAAVGAVREDYQPHIDSISIADRAVTA
jgi:hypothetical protein